MSRAAPGPGLAQAPDGPEAPGTVLLERFLAAFHDRDPGGSARAFAGLPLADGEGRRHADGYAVLADALHAALPALPPGAVLDLACGDAPLLARLPGRVDRPLLGADLSAGELGAARRRLAALPAPRPALLRARAQALPLADGALAAVVCHMALMLASGPESVVAELARVLAPGGRLLALVPAALPPGAAPPPLLAAWLAALAGQPRHADWRALQFAGRRWRDPAALPPLLAPAFDAPRLTLLSGEQCFSSPEQAWDSFTAGYDLHLLPDAAWPAVRAAFLARAAAACDAGGRLRLPLQRLLIDATRRL